MNRATTWGLSLAAGGVVAGGVYRFGSPDLALGNGLRLGLRVLVLGAGYAMWLLGVSYARAKAD